jgi:ribonuclease HI
VAWQRRYFKGKKVYAKVDEAGELVVEDGRVPMKYSASEGAKIYAASPRNLSGPLDEDDRPAKEARSTNSRKKSRSKAAASGTKSPDAPIQASAAALVSTELPDELLAYPAVEDGIVEVYTDGACSGNPGPCGYGLLMRRGAEYREISQYLGTGTNNIAELTAIRVALENVEDKTQPVRIYTDSTYAIGVLTKNWKAKANRELIMGIRALISEFEDLRLIKVKGHAGHPLNERADTLATSSLIGR